MSAVIEDLILSATGAGSTTRGDRIQSLWSGYGEIVRFHLEGAEATSSVIVKHVAPPRGGTHPRGWDTDRSHQRKLRSYQVEHAWYADWAGRCGEGCRVPRALATEETEDGWLFVLEDLDAAGFAGRRSGLDEAAVARCLTWLAEFHATFLGDKPDGLWETGTYWHLATRPDEWEVIGDKPLKAAAMAIDERLNDAQFQTLVHGDAKVANFCFPESGDGPVAAVDFQYVGGGCGMKDVAYFLGSCLSESDCEAGEERLLGIYFDALRSAMVRLGKPQDPSEVEAEWRRLYPYAWTDFHRFLLGWSPGHWKLNGYSGRVATQVVQEVCGE